MPRDFWFIHLLTSPEDQLRAYYHAHLLRKELQSVKDMPFDIQKQLSIKTLNGWTYKWS